MHGLEKHNKGGPKRLGQGGKKGESSDPIPWVTEARAGLDDQRGGSKGGTLIVLPKKKGRRQQSRRGAREKGKKKEPHVRACREREWRKRRGKEALGSTVAQRGGEPSHRFPKKPGRWSSRS